MARKREKLAGSIPVTKVTKQELEKDKDSVGLWADSTYAGQKSPSRVWDPDWQDADPDIPLRTTIC